MKLTNFKVIATILACLTVVRADDGGAIASPDSAVVKLTADSFESFMKENPLVLAEFFAPWCGHCKRLGPEFQVAADKLVEKDIRLAQIDCTEEKDLCSSYGIKGYPTLKVFRGYENEPSDYAGQRTSDSIISYMVKQSTPPVSIVDDLSDIEDTIKESNDPVFIQVLPKGSKSVEAGNSTFFEIANGLRDNYSFISTTSTEFSSKYLKGIKKSDTPSYILFRPNEELSDASIYKFDEIDDTHLIEFLNVESKPLFGEMDGSSFQSYMEMKLPVAYYFYNEISEKDAVSDAISKLAKTHRGKVNFVGLDASKYGLHAKNINMKEEFPLFAIHDLATELKYGISQDKPLDNKLIPKFVEDFVAGKLEAIIKSEPIPETQDSPVYHLVGKEHDKIITSDKDVLVKYYAPWCGHCKKLAPVFEELAAVYESVAPGKVLLADLDHTENDVTGVHIEGYPTIVLYPADGSEPVVYEGNRSFESFSDFIKEKGSSGVDANALKEAYPEEGTEGAPVDPESVGDAEKEDDSAADVRDEL
ncbi:hypothetical protein B5S31_g4332 [[Candida] boidinii]|nr:hypothetical protein B5S31_g4332 [[Candida] boidinii]